MARKVKQLHLELIEGYIGMDVPPADSVTADSDSMVFSFSGKKNNAVGQWVHGTIHVDRYQLPGVARALWRIIKLEEAKLEKKKRALREGV